MAGIFGHCESCGALTRIKYPHRSERVLCWNCRMVKRGIRARFEMKRRQSVLTGSIYGSTRTEQNNVR